MKPELANIVQKLKAGKLDIDTDNLSDDDRQRYGEKMELLNALVDFYDRIIAFVEDYKKREL